MNSNFRNQRSLARWTLLSLSLLLAACSTQSAPPPELETSATFSHVASVEISAETTQAELEANYGGSLITFKPEAGFAILGFSETQGTLSTLANAAPNQDTFSSPEVSALGRSAWAGGRSAWAGGRSAWAGGRSAWAGGRSAWAGGRSAWAGGRSAWAGSVDSNVVANMDAWQQIKLEEAHALSRNLGAGVKVAVIDSGIDYTHPTFKGRLSPSSEWYDFIDNDRDPQEAHSGTGRGHGTAVASIILQIAPQAKILPLRVLDADGKGDTDDVIKAIDWAVQRGADVINISLGSTVNDRALYLMARYANSQGVMIFASSGNAGGSETMTYPARYSWVSGTHGKTLGIGSVDSNNKVSDFTSHGYHLYAVAPGDGVMGAYPGGMSAAYSGTSFAAPMFTGAAALALGEVSSGFDKGTLTDYIWKSLDFGVKNQNSGIDGARLLNVEKLLRVLPGFSEPLYQIVNVNSGKCLDIAGVSKDNGANLQQWSCYSGGNQKFKLASTGEASYVKIVNVNSNKVVDVSEVSHNSGANIHQWDYVGAGNQQWLIKGDGSVLSFVAKHSGQCLDVSGASLSDGANVVQWPCNNTGAQQFKLRLVN